VNVAPGPIGADLGGALSTAQWIVNGYTLTFAALLLGTGRRRPRRPAHLRRRGVSLRAAFLATAAAYAIGLALAGSGHRHASAGTRGFNRCELRPTTPT
jgi:DHA2 family methylenomycin A resistance protein-like MFS transporter